MKAKKVLSLFLVMLLMLSTLAVLPAGAAETTATAISVPPTGVTVKTNDYTDHSATNGDGVDEVYKYGEPPYVVARGTYWFTYTLNIEEDGLYKLVTTRPTNGAAPGEGIGDFSDETTTYFSAKKLLAPETGDFTVGTLELTKGTHVFKFAFTSASTFWYEWRLERVRTDIPAAGGTVKTVDYRAHLSTNGDGTDEVYPGGNPSFVVARTNYWFTYTLNIAESGFYKLISTRPSNGTHDGTALAATLTNETTGETYFTGKSVINNAVEEYTVATIELKAGMNDIKFAFTNASSYWYGFKLERDGAMITAAGGTVNTVDYKDHLSTNGDGTDEVYPGDDPSFVVARTNYWFTYILNAAEAGTYKLISTRPSNGTVNGTGSATLTNETTNETYFTGKSVINNAVEEYTVATIDLAAGTNIVKFAFTSASSYWYGFKLERVKQDIPVTGATVNTVDCVKHYAMNGTTDEVYPGSNPSYVIARVNYWFTYTLNVAEAGTYKLITRGPAANPNLGDAYGNVANLTTGTTYFNEGKQLIKNQTDPYTIGEIYLAKGTNDLKFTFGTNSSTFWYSFTLERVRIDVPAEGITLNASAAQQHYAKSTGTDEFNQTDAHGGNMVVARGGHWFTYSLNVAEAGLYTLVTVRPANGEASGEGKGILTNETTGETYLTGKLLSADTGDYTVGKIYLQAGTNDLKFAFTSASTYWYSFRLEGKQKPTETLYNTPAGGTKAEATAVADGTMSVSVTMPSDCTAESLAVIFAIYQDGRLYKAASNPTAAVSADTPIELSIENVATEAGSTYSYRVFYWNDMTNLQPLY